MKRLSFPLTLLAAAVLLPFNARAQTVYLNETFEDDTVGTAPTDSTQRNATATAGVLTIVTNPGTIGSGNVLNYNDSSTATGGDLEYNVGAAALGSLFVSFDLLNSAPSATPATAANPLIFGVGRYSNTANNTALGSNANRAFGIEFYQTGTTNTLRLRVFGTSVLMTTYTMTAAQNVKVFVNDNDTTTLSYSRPDGMGMGILGANSFVMYLNNALVGTETAAGFTMNTDTTTANQTGDTTGNATIGRLGFNTSTTNTANFLIDNVFASDVPEPSTFAWCAVIALAGAVAWRRRVRA